MAERQNKIVISIAAMVLCMLLNSQVALSTKFLVGDEIAGWAFGVQNWPDGKTFKAGDQLEFKYNPDMHNVIVVDKSHFKSCATPSGAKIYRSGDDIFTLKSGTTYFLCGVPGHCAAGMKIAVTAT